MDPSIALYLTNARHQEMQRQASRERLVRGASDLPRHGLAAMANPRASATLPSPATSAIRSRAA
jgi:hypothetical protein